MARDQLEVGEVAGHLVEIGSDEGEITGHDTEHVAGLDYHEYTPVRRHASWDEFVRTEQPNAQRLFAFTTRGRRSFDGR